jgi:hypothetical protein
MAKPGGSANSIPVVSSSDSARLFRGLGILLPAPPDIRRSNKPYATTISSRSVFPESMRPPPA